MTRRISGCYAWTLAEELWDKMSEVDRFYEIRSLRYSDDILTGYSKTKWHDLKNNHKKMILGEIRDQLQYFSNRKYGTKEKAINRRLMTCPTSGHYKILKEEILKKEMKAK